MPKNYQIGNNHPQHGDILLIVIQYQKVRDKSQDNCIIRKYVPLSLKVQGHRKPVL